MSHLDLARLRRDGKRVFLHLFWGWTFLTSVGATIGAVYGWLHLDNDSSS